MSDKVTDKLRSHNVVSSTPRLSGIRTHKLEVIATDCIGSCKFNYHMITMVPQKNMEIY